jgi:hypothetical protein
MPDPIMEPATIIVESSKPRPRIKPCAFVCVTAAASAIRYSERRADLVNCLFLYFREKGNASGIILN